MRRAYVFRLRPTARQHVALAPCVDGHRELYNAALQERRDARAHSKTRINYGGRSAQLTEMRAARPATSNERIIGVGIRLQASVEQGAPRQGG